MGCDLDATLPWHQCPVIRTCIGQKSCPVLLAVALVAVTLTVPAGHDIDMGHIATPMKLI